MPALEDLKKAKAYSDAKKYEEKHLILRKLIESNSADFMVDSDVSGILGLTHLPTGFKMHLPKQVIAGLNVAQKQANLTPGKGMPRIEGGGQGSYTKLPSLKATLTNASKEVGEKAKAKTPFEKMFPATAKYQAKKTQQITAATPKQANFLNSASKYLGYAPGVWYDDSNPHENRMRFGNVVSGVGLAGLGLASIPILKYLFPERFADKGTALGLAAVAGGMAAPWVLNFPHTAWEFNNFAHKDNKDYSAEDRKTLQDKIKSKTPTLVKMPGDLPEKQSYVKIPLGTPIPKMHLADIAAEQLSSGYIDYGQAAGLMLAASRASEDKPWFTVGDLARTAIGAGAGAIAGTAAAKGIGMFMNLKPTEQKIMQGTGAALGTLINLGKLSL